MNFSRFKSVAFSIAALAAVLTTASALAQEYKIKLVRPQQVGDQYTTHVTAAMKLQVTVNGMAMPLVNQNASLELQGTAKVLEIDQTNSAPKKIEYKVEHFTKDGTDLYPAGTVITGEFDGKMPKYTVDAKPVSQVNVLYLRAVMNLSDAAEIGNEDVMAGTGKPRKVGDTWPMNSAKAAEAMTTMGFPMKAEDLKGESKLVKVKKLNGTPVMQVDTTQSSEKFDTTTADGTSISDGTMHTDISEVLPVEVSQMMISRSTKLHVSMTVTPKTKAGKSVVVIDQDVKEEREAVKP